MYKKKNLPGHPLCVFLRPHYVGRTEVEHRLEVFQLCRSQPRLRQERRDMVGGGGLDYHVLGGGFLGRDDIGGLDLSAVVQDDVTALHELRYGHNRCKVSRQVLMKDLIQVSSVSLLMTSSMALANEGLFQLTFIDTWPSHCHSRKLLRNRFVVR